MKINRKNDYRITDSKGHSWHAVGWKEAVADMKANFDSRFPDASKAERRKYREQFKIEKVNQE